MTFVSRLLHRTRCLLLGDTQSNSLYNMWISYCLCNLSYITLVVFSLNIWIMKSFRIFIARMSLI
jgi:hypothetical protein